MERRPILPTIRSLLDQRNPIPHLFYTRSIASLSFLSLGCFANANQFTTQQARLNLWLFDISCISFSYSLFASSRSSFSHLSRYLTRLQVDMIFTWPNWTFFDVQHPILPPTAIPLFCFVLVSPLFGGNKLFSLLGVVIKKEIVVIFLHSYHWPLTVAQSKVV